MLCEIKYGLTCNWGLDHKCLNSWQNIEFKCPLVQETAWNHILDYLDAFRYFVHPNLKY